MEEFKKEYEKNLRLMAENVKLQAENSALKEELAEAQARANRYFVAGSDGCSACDTGRVTYWKKTMLCLECEKAKQLTDEGE